MLIAVNTLTVIGAFRSFLCHSWSVAFCWSDCQLSSHSVVFSFALVRHIASSADFTVLFYRTSGKMGRERGVTVMPVKDRQGDDLRVLARAYNQRLCSVVC